MLGFGDRIMGKGEGRKSNRGELKMDVGDNASRCVCGGGIIADVRNPITSSVS